MINKILRSLLILLLLAEITTIAFALRQTGSVVGKVTDTEGVPLPGASVTLSGPAMLGSLTYTTTETGDFRFPAVPPGSDYVITVEMPGFQKVKRKGIIVHVGKTVTITVQLKPTPIAEEITVTAPSPTIDVTSSKISVSYSTDLIRNIPLSRDFYDVITSAPGVVSEENYFHRSFSSHGGTVRSNQVALDGVNVTDPAVGTNMIGFSFDIFEEFEFELGAHPAEVGMTDGAYVNIVTKSGGNEFHGQANVYFFNKNMVEDLVPEAECEAVGLTKPTGYKMFGDYALSIGGPIIKDKLWFFVNGRYIHWSQEAETLPDGLFDLTHDEIMTFAKFTFQLHPNLKLVGMWSFGNVDEPVITGFGMPYYRERYSMPSIDNAQNHTLLGMINWIANQNTFFDIRLNYFSKFDPWHFHPSLDPNTPTRIDLYTNVWSGSTRFNEDYTSKRFQILASGTRFLDNFLGGDHEIKAGIEYEIDSFRWDWWEKNPYILFTYNGQPWGLMNYAPYWGMFYAYTCGANKGDTAPTSKLRRFSSYFQDSVTIKDRLTLNLGLRYDETHGDVLGGTFTPGGSTDPVLTMLAPNIFRTVTVSDTKNAILWKDLSPRIGAVFDVFGDGKTSIKASWCRYNEFLMIQYFAKMSPVYPALLMSYWWDYNMDGIIDPGDGFLVFREPLDPEKYVLEDNLDPSLKSPYMNELIIGIERELFKDFSVGISYIYKKKERICEDVEKFRGYTPDSEWWVPYTVIEPGWDGEFGTDDDKEITVYGVKSGAPKSQKWFTNPKGAERKYQALEFIFNKRMSNGWQLLGSVTLSKFEGNIGAGYGATWGFSSAFDDPNWYINRYGRLGFDRPLQIKLQGTVLLPYDFILSGYYFHMSGAPWARTLRIQLPFDPSTFEYPGTYVNVNAEAPGERRYRSRNHLDLRLEKSFKIGNIGTLGIFLDVINVLGESWFDINQDPGGIVYNDGRFETWPTYGDFTGVHGLRTFKVSARFVF